jgi:pimeloyl-ACP methyl ester carboxylesterase
MARFRCSRRLAAAVAGVALAVGACASSGSTGAPTRRSTSTSSTSTTTARPAATGYVAPPLAWHDCDEGECSTLRVPLDYARPRARHLDLAVARASTAAPGRRIGSLLVNPGGPGAPGLDLVDYVATQVPKAITDRFDIVAWDPRGAGKSSPVDCGSDLDARFAPDSSPDDPAELAALEQSAKDLVAACVRRSGDLLAHISTEDTVQDLDVLRAALGDDRLTYMGFSYGTFIGALYAQRYPDHVRALVLDGALDPALPVEDVAIQQAEGFDASLARFVDWCHRRSSCTFHGGGDVRAAYGALVRKADASPSGSGADRFGPTQFDIAVAAVLYGGEEEFPLLASSLRAYERGDPSRLASLYDTYVGRTGNTYDSEWPAFIAISCADGPNLSVAATEALQRRAAAEAPDFGAANIGLGFECAYWPYTPARTAVGPVSAHSEVPILVVGTRGDPATPFAWAESLTAQLGTARLVAVDDSTHTASLNGNACLDGILVRYLVDLAPPAAGAACGPTG